MRRSGQPIIGSWLLTLLLAVSAFAQVERGQTIELRDEGVSVGRVRALDCVGSTIGCTFSASVGTIMITGGSAAPDDATYWVGAAHAGLSAEINLGALGTGLVINTAGTPSIYAGGTCTNQVLTALTASGAGTCATLTSAYTSGTFTATAHNLLSATHGDTSGAAAARGAIIRGNATPAWEQLLLGGSNLYLKSNATDLIYSTLAAGGVGSCTNQAVTALNADAAPTCTTLTSAFVDSSIVPSTRTINTTAPLSGGGALSGNLTLTTSMATARLLGRTTAGAGVAEEISVSEPLSLSALALSCPTCATQAYTTVEDEGTPRTQRTNLNFAGAGVSCADSGGKTVCTISGGGGGGGNFVEVEVNFGAGDTSASTTVTGESWVGASSVIVCSPTAFSTSDRSEGADDAALEQLTCVPHTRVASTGFTVLAHVAIGNTRGRFKCHCTGS